MAAETINEAIKQLMMQGVALDVKETTVLEVKDTAGLKRAVVVTVGSSNSVGIHYAPEIRNL